MFSVSSFTDNEGVQAPITMITYNFAVVPEHEVAAAPHGNSKRKVKNVRRMKSVKSKLSEALAVHTPKEAVTKVLSESGGILGARSAGELLLSIDEAYNLKQSRKQNTHAGHSRGKGHHLLYTVMLQCKRQKKLIASFRR